MPELRKNTVSVFDFSSAKMGEKFFIKNRIAYCFIKNLSLKYEKQTAKYAIYQHIHFQTLTSKE